PPPTRATDVDRFSGDDRSHRLPHVHGIGVHNPRHGLLVGVDVRSGNVFFRPNELEQFGGIPPGHALQFSHRHLVRIANHSTLGAAKRTVHHRTSPVHPTGQFAY